MDSALSSTVPPFITDRQEILSTAIKLPKYQICQLDGKSSRLSSSAVENNFPADFTAATTRRRHESRPKYVEAAVKIRSSGFLPPGLRSNGGSDKPACLIVRLLFGLVNSLNIIS